MRLLSVLATAACAQVFDVGTSQSVQLNQGGTVFLSQGRVGDNSGIACYTDYAESSFGICTLLTLDGNGGNGTELAVGSDIVFNSNATQHVSVATFGDTGAAVVCYSDHGGTERVTCRAIDVNTREMSDPVEISGDAQLTSFISVASIGDSTGLVCFSCAGCSGNDTVESEGQCAVLVVVSDPSSVTLLAHSPVSFSNPDAATEISVQGFDDNVAVVCYSKGGEGTCTLVEASGTTLSFPSTSVFQSTGDTEFNTISVARLAEDSGVVCYADAEITGNYAACSALALSGSVLDVGRRVQVNTGNSSSVSVASLTSTGAIVCYVDLSTLASGDEDVNDADGPGKCNVLTVDGLLISVGLLSVVNEEPTENLDVVGYSEDAAVMCYSNQGAGYGFCMALSLATTTTTSTQTETSSSISTAITNTAPSTAASHDTTPAVETQTSGASTTAAATDATTTPDLQREGDSSAAALPASIQLAGLLATAVMAGACQ